MKVSWQFSLSLHLRSCAKVSFSEFPSHFPDRMRDIYVSYLKQYAKSIKYSKVQQCTDILKTLYTRELS
jgi:hypothetical protein